jgi:nitrate reductase gamma subunit
VLRWQIVLIGWSIGFIRPVAVLAAAQSTGEMLNTFAATVGHRSGSLLIHCATGAAVPSRTRKEMTISALLA